MSEMFFHAIWRTTRGNYLYDNIHWYVMAIPKFKTLHVALDEQEYYDLLTLKAKYHAKNWADLFRKVEKNERQ